MNSGQPAQPVAVPAITGSRVAVVLGRWHQDIGASISTAAQATLREAGAEVVVVDVPGAFELPLAIHHLAATKKYDGFVALGVVIRGDTPHFDYVCDAVVQGVARVQLDTSLPIGFGLLTTENLAQAQARSGGDASDHFAGNKGREAALAVVEMIALIRSLASSPSSSSPSALSSSASIKENR
jgi:6,7-dimethyl-8-ribityllumazine synthase